MPRDTSLQKARANKGLAKGASRAKQMAAHSEVKLQDLSRQQEESAEWALEGQTLPPGQVPLDFQIGVRTRAMSRAESNRQETTGERVPLHQQEMNIRHGAGGDPQGDATHHADAAAGRDDGQ